MRRKSSINREKRLSMIDTARRMTPEQRLEAAANLSQAVTEIARVGKNEREARSRKLRS